MPSITPNLRLSITNRETNKPFLNWRLGIDGPDDSNMIKLDKAWGDMKTMVDGAMAAAGHPYRAAAAADMTDHDKVYVYLGNETGYTAGNWYYWNEDQSAWVSGGVYNATALQTDDTLTLEGEAADAKATGDAVSELNEQLNKATKPLTSTQVSALKSIKDVNAGEYFTANGLKIKQLTDSERNTEISGGNLPAGNVAPEGLTDGVSYIVRSWAYGNGGIAFEIFGTVGRAIWYGGNRNDDKDHFNWHVRSYETYEKDIKANADEIAKLYDQLATFNSKDVFAGNLKHTNLTNNHGVGYHWDGDVCTVRNVDMTVPADASGVNTLIATQDLPDYIVPGKTYYLTYKKEIYLADGESENDTFGYDNAIIQFRFGNGSATTYFYAYENAAVTIPEDAVTWTVSIYVGGGRTVSCRISDIALLTEKPNHDISNKSEDENVFECYTDFEKIQGWYSTYGDMQSPTLFHTQKMRIRPDTDYYSAYFSGNNTLGAFYDEDGYFISLLKGSSGGWPAADISVVRASYGGEDGTYYPDNASLDPLDLESFPASNYIDILKFHTPKNAAYFSLNMSNATSSKYKQYICSKEMYVANGTGNMVIKANDPFYQKYKNKKLCLIGPSTLMVNRLKRTRTDGTDRYIYKYEDREDDNIITTGYVTGFQEYLKPYFAEVKSYGYSGHAWAYGRGDQAHRASIYTWIFGGTETYPHEDDPKNHPGVYTDHTITVDPNDVPDLSGYDVYILLPDGNGLTRASISDDTVPDFNASTTYYVGDYVNYNGSTYKFTVHHTPGAWNNSHVTTVESIDPKTTYVGAITAVLDHIVDVNPRAEVYFVTSKEATFEGATRITRRLVDDKIRELAVDRGYGVIDFLKGNVNNIVRKDYLSYDGKHNNCHGNLINAYAYRKELIGF